MTLRTFIRTATIFLVTTNALGMQGVRTFRDLLFFIALRYMTFSARNSTQISFFIVVMAISTIQTVTALIHMFLMREHHPAGN
jgi:type I site-specific restriction endonuclease